MITLLVVSEEPAYFELIQGAVKKNGVDLIICNSDDALVEYNKRKIVDIVLLDVDPPCMTDKPTAMLIKRDIQQLNAATKLIGYTKSFNKTMAAAIKAVGFHAYFTGSHDAASFVKDINLLMTNDYNSKM